VNALKALYAKLKAHLGKLISGFGAFFISLDIAGYADGLKQYASQILGDKAAQKVGLVLFVLLILRTTWTGMQAKKPPLPPPAPESSR